MKKILITGGAGFIGSNLALALVEKDHEVTVLDNLSKQVHGDAPYNSPLFLSIKDKVNFIEGDVTSRPDVLKAIDGQEIVVHLAAETGTGQSMYEIEKYCAVNIGGTALLLDVIANTDAHNIQKMICASSRSVYGEGKYQTNTGEIFYPNARIDSDMQNADFKVKAPETGENLTPLPTDEGSAINPSSVYGVTKQTQEQLFLTVGKALGIPTVVFRYQNVYGPGQSLSNPYTGILSIFSTLIKNGQAINVFEDGVESRDFVFIDDAITATILGIESDGPGCRVFNVGSGVAASVLTVANVLQAIYGSKVNINITGKYRLGDIRHNYADITHIKNELGFTPRFDFETGVKLFADWVNSRGIEESFYERSISEMKNKGFYK